MNHPPIWLVRPTRTISFINSSGGTTFVLLEGTQRSQYIYTELPYPAYRHHIPIRVATPPLRARGPIEWPIEGGFGLFIDNQYTPFVVPVTTPSGLTSVVIEHFGLNWDYQLSRTILVSYLEVHNLFLTRHPEGKSYPAAAAA